MNGRDFKNMIKSLPEDKDVVIIDGEGNRFFVTRVHTKRPEIEVEVTEAW